MRDRDVLDKLRDIGKGKPTHQNERDEIAIEIRKRAGKWKPKNRS